jgi:hypothetical protein
MDRTSRVAASNRNFDAAVLSGPQQGVVHFDVDTQPARFEHASHKHQLTIGSVVTEFLKVERHQSKENPQNWWAW